MKTTVTVFISLCLTVLSVSVFGQNSALQPQLLHTENGVRIFSELQDCVDRSKGTAVQYIMLQVVNENPTQTRVSFDKELWHAGKCTTCNSSGTEHHVEVIVPANGELIGNCNKEQRGLMIYLRMLELKNVRSLTNYELKNIRTEVID